MSEEVAMSGPLDGIRVLAMEQAVALPAATRQLADLGAEVIRVQAPQRARGEDGPNSLTRNKRMVGIDLGADGGAELFLRLAAEVDVVCHNFTPRVVQKFGIDYESVRAVNPTVIYASVTGFGMTGPWGPRPLFGPGAEAVSGINSLIGPADGWPGRPGTIVYADSVCGSNVAFAVLAALDHRDRTGEGQHIDISMLDVQLSMLSYTATMHLISGLPAERYGNEHGLHVPYNAYKTATGYLFLAVVVDNHWAALAKALSGMKLADAVKADVDYLASEHLLGRLTRLGERDAINQAVANVLATRPRDEWLADLSAAGIPVAPVNTVEDALADDQASARRMVVDIPHPAGASYRAPGNPIKLSAADPDVFDSPPRAGEDTQSVLRDVLGYDDDAIASLLASGAVERLEV